jgi:cytochrome c peroxidase
MKPAIAAALAGALFITGCAGAVDSAADDEPVEAASLAWNSCAKTGKFLFEEETFGGNGRTCRTCHETTTGALSPASAQARYAADPTDPLFRPLDSDDGFSGASYTRLLTHATVLVTIPLPSYLKLADDPTATSVTLERSIPTAFNKNPALGTALMWDGRDSTLQAQALSAVHAHAHAQVPAQNTVEPTVQELDKIAAFESALFSSYKLADYAAGGPPPVLPAGFTASEKRGRKFIEDVPLDIANTGNAGVCALCHSGPMLNTTKDFKGLQPVGIQFSTAGVSELNDGGLPVRTFLFDLPGVGTVPVATPDPGISLIPGNPIISGSPFTAIGAQNVFKIPTLWGVKRTAPYFHDNSAATLEQVVDHYDRFLTLPQFGLPHLSPQDQTDLVAYLKLL